MRDGDSHHNRNGRRTGVFFSEENQAGRRLLRLIADLATEVTELRAEIARRDALIDRSLGELGAPPGWPASDPGARRRIGGDWSDPD